MAHSNPQTLDERLDHVYTQVEAMLSVSSVSTMATADDLPGAGRTLGKLFSFLGRRLEAAMNKFMERRGYGPQAAKDRIVMQRKEDMWVTLVGFPYYVPRDAPVRGSAEDRQRRKDIGKLLRYVSSQVVANHELACEAIIELAMRDSYVHRVLLELGAVQTIGLVSFRSERDSCDALLTPSRKALGCLLDTETNTLGSQVLEMEGKVASTKPRSRFFKPRLELFLVSFLKLADRARRSHDVAYLAMRYLQYNTRFALKIAENNAEGFEILFLKCILDLVEHAPFKIEWPVLEEILCTFPTYVEDESHDLLRKLFNCSWEYIMPDNKEDLYYLGYGPDFERDYGYNTGSPEDSKVEDPDDGEQK